MDNQDKTAEIDWVDQFKPSIDLPAAEGDLELRRIRRADIREQLAEQEAQIEAQWKQRFADHQEQQTRDQKFHEAGHDIAMTALSTLHVEEIEIPSLYHSVAAGEDPDPDVVAELSHLVSHYIKVGADFSKIMNLVHKNPTLKSEWDRFCMFIRLAQD